ncbi:MAG: class B sortase [Clostridia bacterium]|nr:class B sortase [Clostridia bacterium]
MAQKKSSKTAVRILFAVFSALFIFSGVMLVRSLWEYKKEGDEQSRLEDDFLVYDEPDWGEDETVFTGNFVPDSTTAATLPPKETLPAFSVTQSTEKLPSVSSSELTAPPETTELTTAATTAARPKELWPTFSVNWDAIFKRNLDVIGWIWMYDSDISYPVLLGEDNNEYIHTTIDGEYAKFGSIFADYRSSRDFSDRNTVIYGHNGGYGVKFGGLMNYQLKSHWDSHRYICIMTPSGLSKYYIYSAYITKSQGNPYKTSFASDADYQTFIDKTVSSSLYQTGISPTVSDNILTLSTCTNNADDERMVIHGILVR